MTKTENVSYGKPKVGGAVFSAPIGTNLPLDAKAELDPAFKGLGYISEDGLTNENSPESEEIKAWGGDTVLVVQTAKPDIFGFKLIEALNVDVLKEVYGAGNVTGELETGIKISANAKELSARTFIIDMVLQKSIKRIVIPNGKVSEVGEIVYVDGDAIGYDTKIQAMPDSTANTHYEYIVSAE